MEKYTVDIDKVLDDFEETEALKIDSTNKSLSSSLLHPSLLVNCNDESKFILNDADTTYNHVGEVNDANCNDRRAYPADKDTAVKNAFGVNKYLKHLEMPDGCDEKHGSFLENGKVLDDRHLLEQDSISNVYLSASNPESEVLKPEAVETGSLNLTIVPKSELNNDAYSVQKDKSNVDVMSESQIEKESSEECSLISCDSSKLVECSQNVHLVDASHLTGAVNNLQLLEGVKWNFSHLDLKISNVHQENITTKNLSEVSVDKNIGKTTEQNSDADLNVDIATEPSSSKDHNTDTTVLKAEASASDMGEPCSNNSNSVSDCPEENKDVNGSDPINIDPIVLPPVVIVQPEYDVLTDEDSGVSSEEGNNSPLFFFNNRMFNYNNGLDAEADQEAAASADFACSVCDNGDSENNASEMNNSSGGSRSSVIITEIECTEETSPSSSSADSQSCKFAGARPKLETTIQSPVSNASGINSEDLTKVKEGDSELNGNSMMSLSEDDQILKTIEMPKIDSCDISQKSSDLLFVNASCSVESDVSHEINNAEIICDRDISQNAEIFSADIQNQYSTQTSEVCADNLPQRLPRPTTLDLPSRHIAANQISEETGHQINGSNFTSVSSTDFISNEELVDDNVSEPSPTTKQQPQIGLVKPFWVPDSDAPNCMHCGVKFNVIKRRHHCRACGKVLCSRCCNLKAKLAYLMKEDRICHPCFELLSSTLQNESSTSITADSQSSSSCGSSPNFSPSPQVPNSNFGDKNTWRPHPNNPDDYCSTIPPLQQIQLSGTRPPPTVMVPIGVLKRGNKPRREPKQVIFSDGIRPGGDLTDLTEPVDTIPVYRRMGRKRVEKAMSGDCFSVGMSPPVCSISQKSKQKRILVSDEEGPLPPVILQIDNEKQKDEKLDWNQVLERMQDDDQKPINFALLKNMNLFVKLTKLDCCYGKECWCFTSHGLCAVGQDEVIVILERVPGENTLPRGIIKLFTHIYDSASKGTTFEDLGHTIFPEQILGSSDHRGFLFVRPTFQCLSKLVVPNTPFLVAILIHKWEVPWAKVFPLRLMLRLGAECRYYPCALVSVRERKPVFFEIGQTIMSVLADLRNYQFTIPVIPGLVVHMEEKKTCVNIPRNRYSKVLKVLNSNNVEHVLALGSNFSSEADSHLVCMQKEEGDYQTQAINIENTTRRVTGASFIVFSGALKSSSGLSAKFSIVEDGLLVQIPQDTMVNLHLALREMKDMTIECGQINAAEPEEVVMIQWTKDDKKFNIGVRSFIDGRSLEGIPSLRLHTSTDYAGDNHLIRWTEVFFLEVDENSTSVQHELVDPCRLAETVAQSCCMALTPFLDQLAEAELTKIGLRVTLDADRDRVEYDIGARGRPLPATYMNALDSALIPVILRLSGSAQSEPISFELIFYILIK